MTVMEVGGEADLAEQLNGEQTLLSSSMASSRGHRVRLSGHQRQEIQSCLRGQGRSQQKKV